MRVETLSEKFKVATLMLVCITLLLCIGSLDAAKHSDTPSIEQIKECGGEEWLIL